jgi:rhodanese-related sulfurtransferase
MPMIKTLNAHELRQMQESGSPHALVDVRERSEYALDQILGAVPIPRGLLEMRIGAIVPWGDVPVIVYCDDGYRSSRAAETLEQIGYRDVSVLDGGINAWKDAGYETHYGVNVIGKDYGEKVAVQNGIVQLTPQQVQEMRERENVFILDSRTSEEFEKSHVPGAYSVPGGELPVKVLGLLEQPENKDAKIVVNCAGRTRSILGADILRRMGLSDVYALENGTMAWTMAGLDLEHGPARDLDAPQPEAARQRAAEFAENFAREEDVSGISVEDLRQLKDQNSWHYVVDVRLPEEYAQGHIPGAISCPGGQLANALDEYIGVRQARFVCVSNGTTRAKIGAALCKRIGYPDVVYLDGGLDAWREQVGELETARPASVILGLSEARKAVETISPANLKAWLNSDQPPRIMDVRRSSEFADRHIPGSTWIPRGDLERRIERYFPERSTDLVVVSNSGERATLAVVTVQSMDYQRVAVLDRGLDGWQEAGFETEEGLEGADVTLQEAKEDADLVNRPNALARSREDMIAYLEWETRLGDKYE